LPPISNASITVKGEVKLDPGATVSINPDATVGLDPTASVKLESGQNVNAEHGSAQISKSAGKATISSHIEAAATAKLHHP
jgi:hypothetical protein